MKFFILFLGLAIFFSMLSAPDSYGLIMGYPLEFWDSADIILDGTVISTETIDSENLIQHDVKINQIFKNKKPQQMITVYGTTAENEEWFYQKSFEVNERALFYLKKINDKYFILEHSHKATEQCTPRDMIGLSTLPGGGLARGGPTLFFNPYQTCNGFLTPAGFVRDSLPPLKQLEAGITQGDVGCKHDHQLMFRKNSSVACVMQSSVLPLMDRGWMHVENQDHLQLKSALPTIWLDAPSQIDDTTLLDFTIEIMDFVENNNSPTITILDETQNIVWSGQHNNPFNEGWNAFAGSGYRMQYAMHDFPEIVKLDAGQYMLSVSLGNQKITKKLTVTESELIPLEPVVNKDGTLSENTNPYTFYDIAGIKQIYRVGEPISFIETVQGFGNPCVFPHYEILDGNTLEPVWEYQIVYPCPFIKDPQQFKRTNTIPNEKVSSPILNQTGPYILRSYHSYSDGYTVVTFTVVDESFVRNTVDPCNVVYDLDANDLRKRTAPPTSIGEYGRDTTFMEPFVFDTSIGKLSAPSYMPFCYELKSDKIKNDLRTLVFYPNDMTYNDDVTITKIIKEGVFILVSNTSETPEDWSASVEKSIKESSDISSATLKGHTVLLTSGIPSKDMSSTVEMVIDDKKIQVISTKLDTIYLMDVLESMFEN